MDRRLKLQKLLEEIPGVAKVYFQPPPNLSMVYPCIVYQRDGGRTQFSDNNPHRFTKRYQVTVIARHPDDKIHEHLAMLPMTTYDRYFVSDGLNHDVFSIYY